MNREDEAREPVGTAMDQWKPIGFDGYGAPIWPWAEDGRSSD